MKSISLTRWCVIVGLLLLVGGDLHGQNTFPSYGNVGIGTTNPTALLSVGNHASGSNDITLAYTGTITHTWNGSVDHRYILSSNGQNDFGFPVGWDAGALKLRASSGGYAIMTGGGASTNGGEGEFLFFTNSQIANPQVVFRASGNVGIGTIAPGQKLSVAGTIESTTGGFRFPDGTVQTTAAGGGGGTSQWISSSGGIYYPSGTVTVGAHQPGANDIKMDLSGSITHTWNGSTDSRYVLSSNGQNDFGFPVGWDAGALKLRGSSGGYTIMTGGGCSLNGGEGELLFYTNSQIASPQVVFRASGNVGIGTSNPNYKLDVAGEIRASGGIRFSDGSQLTSAAGAGSSQWFTNTGGIYYSGGNVGIGTASPLQKLDVHGRMLVSYSGFAGSSRSAPSQAGSIIELAPGDYEGARNALIYTGLEQNSEKLTFDPGSGPLLTLDGTGRVGIGTATPAQKLSVTGTIESTTGGFKFPDGTVQTTASGGGASQWTVSGVNMYSSNTGNVGLGTASPAQKLDVAGAIAISGTSVIDASRNIVNVASGTFTGNMAVGGNVIIGNRASTSYKLDIVGNVRANEVVVNTDGSDFVFEEGYKLMDLARLADYIKENKHLPDVASADEMQKGGIGVGEMQTKLLQKIEELTLYVINQEKRIEAQNRRIDKLEKENAELRNKSN